MMKSSVFGAAQTFNRLRSKLNTGAVQAGARQPFKFLLCGDPALVAAFRYAALGGTGTTRPARRRGGARNDPTPGNRRPT